MAERLAGMRIAMIVSNEGIEEAELIEPRLALEEAGAEVDLIAPKEGVVLTFNHTEKGEEYPVDATMDEVEPTDYDALLLPGGVVNADALRVDPRAQRFVQQMDEAGKPIGAICHAPWLLISADVIVGRSLTSYHTLADDIINAGGEWADKPVVIDNNWVTSRKPDDIPQFNQAMIKVFARIYNAGGIAA